MFSMQITVNADSTEISIECPQQKGTMTAAELEAFMRELAVVRANMQPALPNQDMVPTSLISTVPCNRWQATIDPDAPTLIRLYLQHLGFGWVWIALTEAQADQMQDAVQKCLRARPRLS